MLNKIMIASAALMIASPAIDQYNGDGWRAQAPATETVPYRQVRRTLSDVQYSVNHEIRPMSDEEQYGGKDMWVSEPPSMAGDCDDYAMTKRCRLIRDGIPASAMQIKKARTWRGEMHAILVVETDEGEMVLDNLVGPVTPRRNWDGWTGTIIDVPSATIDLSGN